MCKLVGTQHIDTTAYHTQANGLVERAHRTLKNARKCHESEWTIAFPTILLGLRAAPHGKTGISTAEMVFSRTLIIPGDFYTEKKVTTDVPDYVCKLKEVIEKVKPVPMRHNTKQKVFVHPDLEKCDYVFV